MSCCKILELYYHSFGNGRKNIEIAIKLYSSLDITLKWLIDKVKRNGIRQARAIEEFEINMTSHFCINFVKIFFAIVIFYGIWSA